MGTNYYVEINRCKCCDRCDTLHIGKSSAGWTFSFRGYIDKELPAQIRSWDDWVPLLINGRIYDEYNRTHTFNEFQRLVEGKQDARNHHANQFGDDLGFPSWTDEHGHSFSGYEFS